jgi:hypothetical protein
MTHEKEEITGSCRKRHNEELRWWEDDTKGERKGKVCDSFDLDSSGSCKQGNEHSVSIKGGELIEKLNDSQFLTKNAAPCSY